MQSRAPLGHKSVVRKQGLCNQGVLIYDTADRQRSLIDNRQNRQACHGCSTKTANLDCECFEGVLSNCRNRHNRQS